MRSKDGTQRGQSTGSRQALDTARPTTTTHGLTSFLSGPGILRRLGHATCFVAAGGLCDETSCEASRSPCPLVAGLLAEMREDLGAAAGEGALLVLVDLAATLAVFLQLCRLALSASSTTALSEGDGHEMHVARLFERYRSTGKLLTSLLAELCITPKSRILAQRAGPVAAMESVRRARELRASALAARKGNGGA